MSARSTPVRVGVLGCAGIARRRMLPAFASCPATEVIAVAGRDRARAEAVAARYGARAVQGYGGLLADDEVEAVYVPLPLALHAEWVEAALRSGRHVLAEKPLTHEAASTAALFALARKNGLSLMENVMFVHHRQHAGIGALVAEGAIGEVRSFHATFTVPRLPADDIRYSAKLCGGALYDTGVYPLRAALHLLGSGLEVVGASLGTGPGFEVDTSGAALLSTPEGATAQLTFGLDHAYRNTYELCGSTGRITLDRAFTPPAGHVPSVVLEDGSGTREIRLRPDDQVANTVAAFAAAVRAGTARERSAGTEGECVRQAELLEAVAASARLH